MPVQRDGHAIEPDGDLLLGLGASFSGPPAQAPVEPSGPRDRRRRRTLLIAAAAILALGGGGTAVAFVQRADAAAAAQVAHEANLAVQAQSFSEEMLMLRGQNSAALWAKDVADRAAAVVTASAALEGSRAALAAAPQAGDVARNTLQAAIDAASAVVLAKPTPSRSTIQAALDALVAPTQALVAAQAAWQVAEDARVAAVAQEQADAAAAQASADAARSARSSRSSAKAPRAAAPPAAEAPAPASGAPEFSAGALGGAINAWRAGQGLPALSVSRSSGLYAHASEMAQAGDIWHGGNDKIVGYAQPASAGSLVQAWANSPGHRAWMANTSVSSMQVGAAVLNDTLYGAVNFS